jgi:hypothetical protein
MMGRSGLFSTVIAQTDGPETEGLAGAAGFGSLPPDSFRGGWLQATGIMGQLLP